MTSPVLSSLLSQVPSFDSLVPAFRDGRNAPPSTVADILRANAGSVFEAGATLVAAAAVTCLTIVVIERRKSLEAQLQQTGRLFFDEYLSKGVKRCHNQLEAGVSEYAQRTRYQDTLSKALERVACLAYSGAIPLGVVMQNHAYAIVADWLLIEEHVWRVRKAVGALDERRYSYEISIDRVAVYYHRRQGEWLALLCFLWIRGHRFHLSARMRERIKAFEALYLDLQGALDREKVLYDHEVEFVHSSVVSRRNRIRSDAQRLRDTH